MEVSSPNINFLKKINPVKVLLLSFVVWSVLFLLAPLEIQIDIDYAAYFLIVLSVFSFIIGYYFQQDKSKPKKRVVNEKQAWKMFKLILLLALVGMLFKLFDRFIIRGVSVGSNYFENRESMEAGGGNFFGVISAFLVPFSYIPLFMYWSFKFKVKKWMLVTIFSLFFFQVFDALLLGSRSVIFILAVMMLLYMFYFKKLKLTFRKTILLIAGVIGFSLIMNYLFIERTKVFAGDKAYEIALNSSNFNYTLTSTDDFKRGFDEKSELMKTLSFTFVSTSQYFTHGMFEYAYLFNNFDGDFALGSYDFIVYKRFLDKITGSKTDIQMIQELAPRQGVYTTLYGPLYLDFGWFTLLFMFLFGKYTNSVYKKAKAGSEWAVLTYFYLFIVIMFSPVFNFIVGAGGIFIFTSFALFKLISKKIIKYEKVY